MTKELSKQLKELYAASDKEEYVQKLISPYVDGILQARPYVSLVV